MKKIITLWIALAFSVMALGQVDVYFKINHMLGNSTFSYNQAASNNLGNNFEMTRVHYYISEIRLIYDGGQDTLLANKYLLVKAEQPMNEFLGSFNINTLESITFGIGVDPGSNHSDITQYPANHPLSFQLPSMHWGWAAGYRFATFEGNTGQSMNQGWQLHALGDKNYGHATITTAGVQNGNMLIIALDADYQKAFKNITVSANLNYHGEDNEAVSLLQNLQFEVFSTGSPSVGTNEVSKNLKMTVAPNPSQGFSTIHLDASLNAEVVRVTDITGKTVLTKAMNGRSSLELNLSKSGLYLVSALKNGQAMVTEKLIIQ